jgi:hypothetical protein
VRAGRTLEAILVDAMHAPAPFEAFARALAAKTHLAWAGLVRWDEAALDGKLEFEWDELGLGPSAPALTSWLARESDLGADLLTAEGNEVGAAGPVVALPLRRPGASPAFLALSFQRRLPRHVRSLLASFPDELQEPLLAALPDRPLLRAAS